MELNIHGDDASEAFPDNAPVMDNKSFGDIKEEKNPESRHLKDGMRGMEQRVHCNDHGNESVRNIALAADMKTFIEIEEEESEDSRRLMRDCRVTGLSLAKQMKKIQTVKKDAENDPTHLQDSGGRSNDEVSAEVSNKGKHVGRSSSRNSFSNREIRRAGPRETSHNKITPASPEQYISIPSETNHVALFSSENGKDETTEVPAMDLTTQVDKKMNLEIRVDITVR
ncbi:hypothetical protein OIU78_002371 [Salix suchowensis]|nr:hypothetical protein OIU78_002371 [Salix suchowensis]